MSSGTLYHTPLIHSLSLSDLQILTSALLFVSFSGIIEWVEENVTSEDVESVAGKHGVTVGGGVSLVTAKLGEFLVPGMIDTHTHAPQYPNLGLGQSHQLLDWLANYTFPTESRFSNTVYAKGVYTEVIKRTLAVGTTTSSYYGSLHLEGCKVLVDVIQEIGQRALVGKCNMDRNCPPTYIDDSTEQSIKDTESLLEYIEEVNNPLILPVLTPRFAISCTTECLESLSKIATPKPELNIQTHLAENQREVIEAIALFPGVSTYTEIYDKFGLLRPGMVLAHCVWLSDAERTMIAAKGAGISHCPNSNMNLKSGGSEVGKMLDSGINVGLGSDCSGGFAIGVLANLRLASMLSKLIAINAEGTKEEKPYSGTYTNKALPIPALWHLATLGGAAVCNLDSKLGNFLPGKEFDALMIKPGLSPGWFQGVSEEPLGGPGTLNEDRLHELFEQFIFTADDRDIVDVWVAGKRVAGSRS